MAKHKIHTHAREAKLPASNGMNATAEVRTFESLKVGDEASIEHTISENDIARFAELSGDYNPLHVEDAYAGTTSFGKRVVHGMFISSLISQLVGMRLPGKYALLMREFMEFKKPAFIDDTVVVTGVIIARSEATRIIELALAVTKGKEIIATGTAHVRVLK